MGNWVKYINGNYTVYFNKDDGTKIRRCSGDVFKPAFPENCDLLISTMCDIECKWCYANCHKNGKFADLKNIPFLDKLHPYTEMAMNMNFPLHPDMVWFLDKLKSLKVFANVTVNQKHFVENHDFIMSLEKEGLINGLGVSITNPDENLINLLKQHKNAVIHVINGIFKEKDYEILKGNNLKMLILGYKDFGRGKEWHMCDERISYNQKWLYDNLEIVMDGFEIVSFDNLALKQLDLKDRVDSATWDMNYMGDDGTVTFAINLVERTFSKNSMSKVSYPIKDMSVDEMLNFLIQSEKSHR